MRVILMSLLLFVGLISEINAQTVLTNNWGAYFTTSLVLPNGSQLLLPHPSVDSSDLLPFQLMEEKDSTLLFKGNFVNQLPQGRVRWFHPNGRLNISASVMSIPKQKNLTGYFDPYYEDSVFPKKDTIVYLFNGPFESWHSTGIVNCSGHCTALGDSSWIKTGTWKYYHSDGSQSLLETYNSSGLKDGLQQAWYANGQLQMSGNWQTIQGKSLKHGEWKVYDLEGNLVVLWKYDKGIKVAP